MLVAFDAVRFEGLKFSLGTIPTSSENQILVQISFNVISIFALRRACELLCNCDSIAGQAVVKLEPLIICPTVLEHLFELLSTCAAMN